MIFVYFEINAYAYQAIKNMLLQTQSMLYKINELKCLCYNHFFFIKSMGKLK